MKIMPVYNPSILNSVRQHIRVHFAVHSPAKALVYTCDTFAWTDSCGPMKRGPMIPVGITMCPFLSSPPPKHTDTCLLWQIACDVPLWTWHERIPSLSSGLTAEEPSTGQDAPVSALGPLTAREPFSAFRWERQWRRSCLDGNAGCTRGAKGAAVGVEPGVNLIPQMPKFMHRSSKRTCSKAQCATIFCLREQIVAVKQPGSDRCLETSNTTGSFKWRPISEEEWKGGQVTPELQGQQVNNG